MISVESYGAVPGENGDPGLNVMAIQNCVNSNPAKAIVFPGLYNINQAIYPTFGQALLGESKYTSGLKNVGNSTDTIVLRNSIERLILRDLQILGCAESRHGVVFEEAHVIQIDNCWIRQHGGSGIYLDPNFGVFTVNIHHSEIEANGGCGIVGVANNVMSEKNAIYICDNRISNNYADGVSLWGSCLSVERCVIEGNKGVGIKADFNTQQAGSTYGLRNLNIQGNFVEFNEEGCVSIASGFRSTGGYGFASGVSVDKNFFNLSASKAKLGVTFLCRIQGASLSWPSNYGVRWGRNSYLTADLLYLDAGSSLHDDSYVDNYPVPDVTGQNIRSKFANLGLSRTSGGL